MSPRPSLKPNQVQFLRALVEWDALDDNPPQACFFTSASHDFQITDASGARPSLKTPFHPQGALSVFAQHGLVDLAIAPQRYGERFKITVRQEAYDHVKWLGKWRPLKWLDRQLENTTKREVIVGIVLVILTAIGTRLADPLLDRLGVLLFLSPIP